MKKITTTQQQPNPKYKIGDTIESLTKHKGKIFLSVFNDASNEWVYYIKTGNNKTYESGMASVKESNIKIKK